MGKKKVKKKKIIGSLKKNKSINIDEIFSLAIQYHQAGQLDQAIQIYQTILKSNPENHAVHNLFGLALHAKGLSDRAFAFLSKAATLSPETAKYHYDLGAILQSSEKDEESISHYRSALKLNPQNGAAWENLGVALSDCGYNQEAISAFEAALEINTKSVLALTNLSTLRRWQGLHQQALELLNTAILVEPTHVPARMKRAEVLLSLGDFEQGWDEYTWRLIGAGRPGQDLVRFVPLPKWDGQLLAGKTLLVYAEQGIGDEVMFASCLPDLLGQKGDIHFLCDPRMVSLFRRSFPEIKISPNISGDWGQAGETVKADLRVPIGDLPKFYRCSADDFSQQNAYLSADVALFNHWQHRLKELGSGLRVGLSWRGGRQKYTQRARSISLESFVPLLSLSGITFVNLQYGDCQEELDALPEQVRSNIASFDEVNPLVDLENFSAVIANLDLVISVDNSTVHFAGALGVPTWLLLPALADWRWPVKDSDSRWYPSVQLFRQQYDERDSWAPIIDQVVQKISEVKCQNIETPEVVVISPEKQPKLTLTLPQAATRKALLLNDTTFWYHWGCTCTSQAIRNNLQDNGWAVRGVSIHYLQSLHPVPANFNQWNDELFRSFKGIYKELCESLEKTDVVVVNGEGSLHGSSPLSINLLYLMHISKTYFGKPVHVINHSCYPDGQQQTSGSELEKLYQQVYTELDHVAVREPVSVALLEDLGIKVTQSFDCLPLFVEQLRDQISHREPQQIVFAGSVAWNQKMLQAVRQLIMEVADGQCRFIFGANAYPAGDDIAFVQQLQKALPGQVELVYAQSEVDWLSAISSAKLLISGRFHHSIAAACLDTPFIVLDSNTPKISGLMQTLELQTFISSKSPQFGNQLLTLSGSLLDNPDQGLLTKENHQKILSQAEKNFTGLI